MKTTTIDCLLLFLAGDKGLSGYDIRSLFQATPLSIFSDSPGAIYPALARLERRGLLSSKTERKGRRRRVFGRTPAGAEALKAWLTTPGRQAFGKRPEVMELRFVMTAETLGSAKARDFLRTTADEYAAELVSLKAFAESQGRNLTVAAREALDLGIRLCRTRLQWCREKSREQKESPHGRRRKAVASS